MLYVNVFYYLIKGYRYKLFSLLISFSINRVHEMFEDTHNTFPQSPSWHIPLVDLSDQQSKTHWELLHNHRRIRKYLRWWSSDLLYFFCFCCKNYINDLWIIIIWKIKISWSIKTLIVSDTVASLVPMCCVQPLLSVCPVFLRLAVVWLLREELGSPLVYFSCLAHRCLEDFRLRWWNVVYETFLIIIIWWFIMAQI